MWSLQELCSRLQNEAHDLLQALSFETVHRFVVDLALMKNDIILVQPHDISPEHAPPELPPSVKDFIGRLLSLTPEQVSSCWNVLSELVWNDDLVRTLKMTSREALELHGAYSRGLAEHRFYPPSHYCQDETCDSFKKGIVLKRAEQKEVTVYTVTGPRAGYDVYLRCLACSTDYHHNYCVRNGMRYYYQTKAPPAFIQIGEHQYVQLAAARSWKNAMLVNSNAATGISNQYNMDHEELEVFEWDEGDEITDAEYENPEHRFSFNLQRYHVLDAFFLLSLIQDHISCGTRLEVTHCGKQKDRFSKAIEARNARYEREGLPHVLHRCDKCTRYLKNPSGSMEKVSAVVVDGVTIGHVCCSIFNCKIPVDNQRHRYCSFHKDKPHPCAIMTCKKLCQPSELTCDTPAHRGMEEYAQLRNKSYFQLHDRLKVSKIREAENSMKNGETCPRDAEEPSSPDAPTTFTFDVDSEGRVVGEEEGAELNPEGPKLGNTRMRAQFGRKFTHNEQIIIAPCGVIIARRTFYGSEGVKEVLAFIKEVYERTGYLPEFIFYDNNCHLLQSARKDPYFSGVKFPVDVFHFNCKHSKKDEFCQQNCNPAKYQELQTADGKWFFNSSAAEQINNWLRTSGKYPI
ncbi:hypothetical protein EIP91_009254 [Steccherinum ochraceum]|uniref:CxC6 like cysteine cluster associated with KDZ domain-containing protein n=1 Tax=Steccherinum ochraceum TaxID=92696 RepID=A0A4R0RBL8_9APHY|nr:hypothetical protein EIP91_009254 [Steccherinum ochraceum]